MLKINLYNLFNLNNFSYSYRGIEESLNNPIICSLYNSIINLENSEIESVSKYGGNLTLYEHFLYKDALLFGALIEKNTFNNKYSDNLKWCLNNLKFDNNFTLFNILFKTEKLIDNHKFKNDINLLNKEFLKTIIDELFYDKNKNNLLNNLQAIKNYNHKLYDENLNSNVFSFIKNNIFNNDYIRILPIDYLNNYLIKTNLNKNSLWIGSFELEHLQNIISLGFKFDNSIFDFNNKSLITNILEPLLSKQNYLKKHDEDVINIIFNNLNHFKPPQHLEEAENIILLKIKNNCKNDIVINNINRYEIGKNNENILSKIDINEEYKKTHKI